MKRSKTILLDLSDNGSQYGVAVSEMSSWSAAILDPLEWDGAEVTIEPLVNGVPVTHNGEMVLTASNTWISDEHADITTTLRFRVSTESSSAGLHGRIRFFAMDGDQSTASELATNADVTVAPGNEKMLTLDLTEVGDSVVALVESCDVWRAAAMDGADWGSGVVNVRPITGGASGAYTTTKNLSTSLSEASDLDASSTQAIEFRVTTAGSGHGRIVISGSTAKSSDGSVDAGEKWNVTDIKTAAYTAAWGDLVRVDATSHGFTVTLPSAADRAGHTVVIKEVGNSTQTVTVDGSGSETIDGASSISMTTAYGALEFVSDGQNVMVK